MKLWVFVKNKGSFSGTQTPIFLLFLLRPVDCHCVVIDRRKFITLSAHLRLQHVNRDAASCGDNEPIFATLYIESEVAAAVHV